VELAALETLITCHTSKTAKASKVASDRPAAKEMLIFSYRYSIRPKQDSMEPSNLEEALRKIRVS